MPDNLTTWLHEQITAAEASTRTLLYWAQQTVLTLKEPRLLGKEIPGWHDWPNVEKMCQQRLAELDAKRRILAALDLTPCPCARSQRCVIHDSSAGPPEFAVERYVDPVTEMILSAMALPYDDKPGYQERWRRP
ncbi:MULTISPECIES: DUF6221 family protein [unclassified Micromonospora]|uniref:DUF6221 family protein n=1 Tax=unclassified Micromonospora TaxID=2617518 RepID=UPI00332A7465